MMSPVIDRLAELFRHLDHLRQLRPRVTGPEVLSQDLSLHNNILRSLQTVCQVVIDVASELSARRKLRFQDYTEAVRNLGAFSEFPTAMVRELEKLPAFCNVLVYDYFALDFNRVIEALDRLEPIEEFAETVRRMEMVED
jgi:uncharacterized protein YutE (UPF0331/DUF86 family)